MNDLETNKIKKAQRDLIRVTCPVHFILLDLIISIYGESTNCDSTHTIFSVSCYFLSYIQLFSSASFSYTFNLPSSLNVRDQISHPYKVGKITVLYILTFKLLDRRWEDKIF
jgi:hypothetical protein